MKFATWNSLGDFTSQYKVDLIQAIERRFEVMFIQEGGVEKSHLSTYKVFRGQGVGAFNQRCTNYILLDPGLVGNGVDLATIGGGIAGRKPGAVVVGNKLLVSWHSSSSSNNSDTSQLIDEVVKYMGVNGGIDHAIIGGDFNTDPDSITMMINEKSAKFPGWLQCAMVINSGKPTHRNGSELDFFVLISRQNAPTPVEADVLSEVGKSDHWAVMAEFAVP